MVKEAPVVLTIHELETTFGVLFVGYVLAMVGYGFTFFQSYVYFSRFPHDSTYIRALVISLCLLDTVASALASHMLYHYLVRLFPLTTGLVNATPTFSAELAISFILIFAVQSFYAYRVWTASKNAFLAVGVALLALCALVLGTVTTTHLFMDPSFASFDIPSRGGVMAAAQGLVLVTGCIEYASLCFYLAPLRNPQAFQPQGRFQAFMTYIVTRPLLASLSQLVLFATFVAHPSRPVWLLFHLLNTKLYVNSLLAMFNHRQLHHGQGFNEEDSAKMSSARTMTLSGRSSKVPANTQSAVQFNVDQKSNISIGVTRSVQNDHHVPGKPVFEEEIDEEEERWQKDQRREYSRP